jgi:hypothetical protein
MIAGARVSIEKSGPHRLAPKQEGTSTMNTRALFALGILTLAVFALGSAPAFAHCQIPCGIYGDQRVVSEMEEHIMTVEKGMNQINELSKDPGANANQLTRWVINKDEHAQEIQQIALDYFLAQRVKLDEAESESYNKKLALLHQIIVYSMKCKQTTDLANVEALKKSLAEFKALYFAD